MLIKYKKNKMPACYDSDDFIRIAKSTVERYSGSFESCNGCPYTSPGFICYSSEGDCLRTHMKKIYKKKKQKTEESK